MIEQDYLKDFQDFNNTSPLKTPHELDIKILQKIKAKLSPSPYVVFAKLLAIHTLVGTLSLGICNQFDMNPFHTSFSLSHYFMKFGHSFCMVGCGFFFIGLSIFLAHWHMTQEEFALIKKQAFLQVFLLSVISLIVFITIGADVILSIGLFWLIGALSGGLLAFKIPIFEKNSRLL